MKYPNFLQKGDLIGITALSKGCGDVIKETKISLNHLKENYRLIVTPNVYESGFVSSDIKTRVKEFNDLLDENIKMLMNIRGGDFLYETLDFLDYPKIVNKKLLVQGYSDPTSLLYMLTTKYDLATIYGFNGKSYDNEVLEEYQLNNLEILKGNLVKQESFMDRKTLSLNGNFKSSGIIIGGCLDVLQKMIGTSYDNTLEFIKKYGKHKIIWYFDIYNMSSVDVYLTFLQMKNIGYFKKTDTIILGSVMFPCVDCELDYKDVYSKVFEKCNIIVDANIGHVKPVFTIINGSLATITYQDNKMVLEMELLNESNC